MSPASHPSEAANRNAQFGPDTEWILVVEDDLALLQLIERCLQAHGHRTVGARDGATALAALEPSPPRLMVLDYSLPDMQGEQLLEEIEQRGKQVPFIVATGRGSESVAVEMMKRGAYDYLVKGTSFLRLLPAVVDQAIDRARQAQRLADAEDQLRKAHDELEQHVEQRTSELAEANRLLRLEMEERRRAEGQVLQHQAELAHFARLTTIGEMVAELTHELNQPLSAVCSFAQACERLLDSDDVNAVSDLHTALNQINEQANRAAEIIRRMRRFTTKSKSSRTLLDINAMLRDVAELMSIDARMAGAAIAFDLAEALPPVLGDRVQLEQVIVNLMRNGFEALRDSDQATRCLTLRTALDGKDRVVVAVHDNGAGIPEDVARNIFNRFFTTKADGMGMGLPISQSIVENHGGRLHAESDAAHGTTFRFTLPSNTEHCGGN